MYNPIKVHQSPAGLLLGLAFMSIIGMAMWFPLASLAFQLISRHELKGYSVLLWVQYALFYWDNHKLRMVLILSAVIGAVPGLVMAIIALLPNRSQKLYGDARFANPKEIREAGLMKQTGLLLARLGKRYLMLDEQGNIALIAPPRSGKGFGLVVPNLLNWRHSSVVFDPKGELWRLTAGYRQSCGHEVFKFDPSSREGDTHCWNPIDFVSRNPDLMVGDVQNIAAQLFPDTPGEDPFFSSSARMLFTGVVLYLLETPALNASIGDALELMSSYGDSETFVQHWLELIENRDQSDKPLSAPCKSMLLDFFNTADRTLTAIRKSMTSRLEVFIDPIVRKITSRSDFNPEDFRKKKITVYTCVSLNDMVRFSPLVNLFFSQVLAINMRETPEDNPELTGWLLMLLDELPVIGKMELLLKTAGFNPGYNIILFIIAQSHDQLTDIYGQHGAKALLKAMLTKIYFAPDDFEDADKLSRELGKTTVKDDSSRSRPMGGGKGGSTSERDHGRELALPQELKNMGKDKLLILKQYCLPVVANKICYYAGIDAAQFKPRLMTAPKIYPYSQQALKELNESPRRPTGDSPEVKQAALNEMAAARKRNPKAASAASTSTTAQTDSAAGNSDTGNPLPAQGAKPTEEVSIEDAKNNFAGRTFEGLKYLRKATNGINPMEKNEDKIKQHSKECMEALGFSFK